MRTINYPSLGTILISALVIGFGGLIFYKYNMLVMQLEHINHELHVSSQEESSPAQPQIERIVSSAVLWRPIQQQVRDTVIQIIAQVAAIDLLQPYKTPTQGASYGSGFFISDSELITNAHVVHQAKAVWIQIPSLGKMIIDVDVVGISPERDIALLRLTDESKTTIEKYLGTVPFLPLGDSDAVLRSDEVLALGYPLGQHYLKSTNGIISGGERHLIQTNAAINPGSSGGPLLNTLGEVIGINSSGVVEAQNVGYAIPINDLKLILNDLRTTKLLRRPFLGVFFNNGSPELTEYLGNPHPGGCYVLGVVPGGAMDKAGVLRGDMIYALNGNPVDLFGEMQIKNNEDKISIVDYAGRLPLGRDVEIEIYRQGKRLTFTVQLALTDLPAVHKVYPGYEEIDYEIFGGMVVQPLSYNHIQLLANESTGLAEFAEVSKQNNPVLVVTHLFPNSPMYRMRTITVGSTIGEINGEKVRTLAEFRQALKKGIGQKYITIAARDNISRMSEYIFVVLDIEKALLQEQRLSADYKYPLSDTIKELFQIINARRSIKIE